ncbi:hypothetical protein P0082_03040 [Candidatus Haliotispira prima]|uniref:YggS family pyridoxal phosphate-dependent enzyme n=1 Tax=Candidatus Haliotispira prima TaxID=3034016 RepID=A0ABY8MJ52_9SPIO|nr:hypothetical protein P0082_03040 [Candidatus Haliotispira prima]
MFLPERYWQLAGEVTATMREQAAQRLALGQSVDIRILLVSKYRSREDIYSVLDHFNEAVQMPAEALQAKALQAEALEEKAFGQGQEQSPGKAIPESKPSNFELPNFGENYVQGAALRREELEQYQADKAQGLGSPGSASSAELPELELIGPLQSNKAAKAIRLFRTVHSVSRIKLLQALEAAWLKHSQELGDCVEERAETPPDIFFQYNAGGEEQKNGCRSYDELRQLTDELLRVGPFRLRGLMCMGIADADAGANRRAFAECRELARRLWRDYAPAAATSLRDNGGVREGGNGGNGGQLLPNFELSMGMSRDYREALAEGANVLRIGSLLFAG